MMPPNFCVIALVSVGIEFYVLGRQFIVKIHLLIP